MFFFFFLLIFNLQGQEFYLLYVYLIVKKCELCNVNATVVNSQNIACLVQCNKKKFSLRQMPNLERTQLATFQ